MTLLYLHSQSSVLFVLDTELDIQLYLVLGCQSWPRPPVSVPMTASENMVGATVESGSCGAQLTAATGYRGELTTVALVEAVTAVHNTITFGIFFPNTHLAGALESEAGTRHHWKAITHGLLSTLYAGGLLPACQCISYQCYLGFG